MTTLYRQRTNFEKELLASLPALIKKTGWKKNSSALFKANDGYFQNIFISSHRACNHTTVDLGFKPLALDPILWDILDIPENINQPLSFHAWGAFTCSSPSIFEAQIELPGQSPQDVAETVASICIEKAELYRNSLARSTYSDFVENHPTHRLSGAYAITLVTSLINDGNFKRAHELATMYVSGELHSCSQKWSRGECFHQLALKWLDADMHSKKILDKAAQESST